MSELVKVAQIDELKDETMKAVLAQGREILLARVGDKYYATDNHCTHMRGGLSR